MKPLDVSWPKGPWFAASSSKWKDWGSYLEAKSIISFLDINGERQTKTVNDLLSVVIQHEMDHLDGKMMVDFISNVKREMIRKRLSKAKIS